MAAGECMCSDIISHHCELLEREVVAVIMLLKFYANWLAFLQLSLSAYGGIQPFLARVT